MEIVLREDAESAEIFIREVLFLEVIALQVGENVINAAEKLLTGKSRWVHVIDV